MSTPYLLGVCIPSQPIVATPLAVSMQHEPEIVLHHVRLSTTTSYHRLATRPTTSYCSLSAYAALTDADDVQVQQ